MTALIFYELFYVWGFHFIGIEDCYIFLRDLFFNKNTYICNNRILYKREREESWIFYLFKVLSFLGSGFADEENSMFR